jgi:HemY protein
MIRVVVFLIVIGLLSLGAAWLADRPGDVLIIWQGLRIKTSVMVLIAGVVIAMAALALLWTVLRSILRSPMLLRGHLRHRRGVRAYEAISSGLIAVGSGNVGAARKLSAEVNRLAPGEPLALLLTAQAAQLAGDRDAADRTFRAMASRTDTKALGLHGLFIEAQRREDPVSARAYAEEAARTSPALAWAARAVLEFRCAGGDWDGALALLDANKSGLDKDTYRRQRAVLLTARALAAEDADRDNAKASAVEAVKLAPTLVPAASLAGRLLAEGGELRKAARIIEKAWRANPHPELAETYAGLRYGDSARDRLARIESLAKKAASHVTSHVTSQVEGALATMRAAIDAQEFAKARAAIAPYLAAPTKRIALLMAELERRERNDEGRAREWLSRALHAAPDPAWTADGYVSDRWHPASPVSGRLDAFEWRVPLAGDVGTTPVIEPGNAPKIGTQIGTNMGTKIEAGIEPKPATPIEFTPPPPGGEIPPPAAEPSARPNKLPQPKSGPVIPLVHAPDDPGPEAVEEAEVQPEAPAGGWRKIFE